MLAGGIAVIGDPDVYASAGDTRIADVEVDADGVRVTVLGAGERVRVVGLVGAPDHGGRVVAGPGLVRSRGPRDDGTGAWEVAVELGGAGWSKLHFRAI